MYQNTWCKIWKEKRSPSQERIPNYKNRRLIREGKSRLVLKNSCVGTIWAENSLPNVELRRQQLSSTHPRRRLWLPGRKLVTPRTDRSREWRSRRIPLSRLEVPFNPDKRLGASEDPTSEPCIFKRMFSPIFKINRQEFCNVRGDSCWKLTKNRVGIS